jgi:acyl-CoA dehydrogenase family member 9
MWLATHGRTRNAKNVAWSPVGMREQSFMKSLFFGVIAEGLVFPWPELEAREVDTLRPLLDDIRRYLDGVDSANIDREQCIAAEVLAGLKELGLFGMMVPRRYGGAGLSTTGYARVLQELGAIDASIAVTIAAHQSIGMQGLLLFGSPETKDRYLPRLATGEMVAAFALTEPGAGSDAAAIQTHAERRGDDYVLNGSKIWITNGGIADLFTVFARTSPADEGVKPKITAFLVERSWGVRSGANASKLGIRGSSTTEVFFENVKVPASSVLGEPGRGFKVAMEVLNSGRMGLASGALGMCKRVIKMAVERCNDRRAFNRPIGEFGLIKDKVASMMADTWALECMTYLTTGMVDAGVADFSVESAICKVYGSETCWRVVNEALQIAAGIGYMADQPYERILRDARVNLIFEGTNEILRAFIALSGMQGPGRERADVARAMREPIKGFGLLSDFAIRRARTVLGRERMTRHHPALNREAWVFEEYVQELARVTAQVLRKHGRDIAEMQYTQKRTAEMAIDLYAIAACIARTTRAIEQRSEEGARREIDLTRIFVTAAERRLEQLVATVDKNDDELRKAVASKAYVDGRYPFDLL